MILTLIGILAAGFWFGGFFGGIVVGLLLVIGTILFFIHEQLGRMQQ